jgi:hypothetical protein
VGGRVFISEASAINWYVTSNYKHLVTKFFTKAWGRGAHIIIIKGASAINWFATYQTTQAEFFDGVVKLHNNF